MTTESSSGPPKPPLKRSLFNKPAWSRPQKVASPQEFFHRSSSAYADVAAEAERKRKAKLARKEVERKKRCSDGAGHEDSKRQRVSSDSDSDTDATGGKSDPEVNSSNFQKNKQTQASIAPEAKDATGLKKCTSREPPPKTLCKSYEETVNAPKASLRAKELASNIIELEDSDEDVPQEDDALHITIQAQKPPPPEDDDFPPSDDEYAELARKAREKARSKRLEKGMIASTYKQSPSVEPEGHVQRSLSFQLPTPPPPAPDPEVHIFITSPLENTEPLIIKRKLSQRLKEVRQHWCQRNQFSEDMSETIWLTWRNNKLHDLVSCKSLGIVVDEDGIVSYRGQKRLFGEEEQKIHMEAMTEELLEARKQAKIRKAEQEAKSEDEEEEPEEPQVKLIMKAKGFDDMKIIVKAVSRANDCMTALYSALTKNIVYRHSQIHCSFPPGPPVSNRGERRLSIIRWRSFRARSYGWGYRAQRYGSYRRLRQVDGVFV